MSPGKQAAKTRAEVEKLVAAERELSLKRAAKVDELKAAEPDIGEATLAAHLAGEGSNPNGAATRVAKLHAEVDALSAGIDAARRARTAAITQCFALEAEDLREQAADLRTEAAKRQERTDAMLAELEEYEGVTFIPQAFTFNATGIPAVAFEATNTGALVSRAELLEQQALESATRRVVTAGSARGADLDSVMTAVWRDPFNVGPTMADVAAWLDDASAKVRDEWLLDRRSQHLPTDALDGLALALELRWRLSAVVPEQSRVTVAREPVAIDASKYPFAPTVTVAPQRGQAGPYGWRPDADFDRDDAFDRAIDKDARIEF